MRSIRRVIRLRHAVQSVRRVDADDFRCLERFARLKLPGKVRRVQPHDDARRPELLDLRPHRETAAVNEAERVDLPGHLPRLRARERKERRLLMGACAARARCLLDTAHEAAALETALRRVAAVEAQPVERMVGEIDAEARGLLEPQRLLASIFELHGAREHAVSRKNGIGEYRRETSARVAQRDLERLRLILPCAERGQPRKRWLAAQDAVAVIEEIHDIRPVRQRNTE